MKLFVCILIAIIALEEVNSVPRPIETHRFWNWTDIIPNDVIIKPVVPQPAAHPKREPKKRIFNGRETNDNDDVKFQVRLLAHKKNDQNKDSIFGCGGSIISAFTVMTACHCVQGATVMEVHFGVKHSNDIGHANIQSQTVKESAFRKPTTFNPLTLVDDIALIILPVAITFSDIVGPIALPVTKTDCVGYSGHHVSIYGWGRINDAGTQSEMLKTSVVDLSNGKDCSKVYNWLFNNHTMICADGSQYTGTCKGDSGGPLVEVINGNLTQIGIVSYGTKNCETTEPRVYTCVASHLDWINANMKK